MPYAPSKHVTGLDVALQEIIANILIGTAPTFPAIVREYCVAAGVFLAHAQFENFFVDLVDSLARAYSSGRADELPNRLRAYFFLKNSNLQTTISLRIAGGSEHEFLDRTSSTIAGPAKHFIDQSLPLPALEGEDIHGEQSYPSTNNIKKVLKRIGVGDPASELNKNIQADAILLLESLASLRTALAHAASLPSISTADIIKRIEGLHKFATSFDKVIYAQLVKTHSEASWHTYVA